MVNGRLGLCNPGREAARREALALARRAIPPVLTQAVPSDSITHTVPPTRVWAAARAERGGHDRGRIVTKVVPPRVWQDAQRRHPAARELLPHMREHMLVGGAKLAALVTLSSRPLWPLRLHRAVTRLDHTSTL